MNDCIGSVLGRIVKSMKHVTIIVIYFAQIEVILTFEELIQLGKETMTEKLKALWSITPYQQYAKHDGTTKFFNSISIKGHCIFREQLFFYL